MELPKNRFKAALREGRLQIGLWSTLSSGFAADVLSDIGYDWLVLDAEHSPTELSDTLHQLMALARVPETAAVVRPPWNDPVMLKRYLDIGTQNFLIPMVNSEAEARAAVAACRYPPQGIRGVAVAIRANRFGRVKDYLHHANEEICVIVQVETREAIRNLEAIASVEGVDGVFIGPSDLSAAYGKLGGNRDPEMQVVIEEARKVIARCGKASGILTGVEEDAQRYIRDGFVFVAVGNDLAILARQAEALRRRFPETR
ncbi:MAG: 4-hydroxy-2-oxoheptanedioate aldolase [Thalassobaculales bacterium]